MAIPLDPLDIDFVRAQFPAFSAAPLQGQAFFENAGGSYCCGQVISRLTRYYHERKVQPYAAYAASRLAGEEMDEARSRLAAFMGARAQELSFGPSTTQNTYVLAQAFAEYLNEGDEIIVTNQDHEANSGPWRRLAQRGMIVKEWRVDPQSGHLSTDDLTELLSSKTRLLCFPHCSNVVGEINPVQEICAKARSAGVLTCVDGVSYAPHGLPDFEALGADIYLFSAYKTYGPHQGLMLMRSALAAKLPNQGHYFNGDVLYKRFTPAGPDHAQVAASAGIADYIDTLAAHHGINGTAQERGRGVHDLMRAHEIEVMQPVLDAISAKNSWRLLGPKSAEMRAPTLAISLQKEASTPSAKAIAGAFAAQGLMVGAGDFYACRALEGMGVEPGEGVLRLSLVHYTSKEECARLAEAIRKA